VLIADNALKYYTESSVDSIKVLVVYMNGSSKSLCITIVFVSFQILVSYWLSNGYTFVPTEDYWIYNHLIGEQNLPGITNFIHNLSENGTYLYIVQT
jgi:hypothetical protein